MRSTAESVVAGIGGAAGIVPAEGPVGAEAFTAFRDDVAAVSSLDVLGYVAIVPADERAAFETSLGRPIVDLGPEGFVIAPDRPVYWPVSMVAPVDPLTSQLFGLDVGASPITAETARTALDTGRIVATEAVDLGPGLRVFFVVKALYRLGMPIGTVEERHAAHAGFLASAYVGDALDSAGEAAAPEQVRFVLRDGDVELASSDVPPGPDAMQRTVDVAGRSWTVEVEDDRPVDHDLSWFLAAMTLVLVGALLYVIARSARYERRIARVGRLVGATADLAQHLAGAATSDEVAEVIDRMVAPMYDAERSRLVLLAAEAPSEQLGTLVADAVRSREVTIRPRSGGTGAAAILPLESVGGDVQAVVEVVWAPRRSIDETLHDSLRTVVELCEQTLERAAATDLATARAQQLAQLAEGLAGAVTVQEVASRITDLGRQPVGATAASVGLVDEAAGVLRVNHGENVDDRVRQRFANPPLESRLAFTDAARTGERVLVED
ncbi:MAG: CHASE domain-containing protein, partial [Microthrixaceae bacterium]